MPLQAIATVDEICVNTVMVGWDKFHGPQNGSGNADRL
jgi:hypothetical protein